MAVLHLHGDLLRGHTVNGVQAVSEDGLLENGQGLLVISPDHAEVKRLAVGFVRNGDRYALDGWFSFRHAVLVGQEHCLEAAVAVVQADDVLAVLVDEKNRQRLSFVEAVARHVASQLFDAESVLPGLDARVEAVDHPDLFDERAIKVGGLRTLERLLLHAGLECEIDVQRDDELFAHHRRIALPLVHVQLLLVRPTRNAHVAASRTDPMLNITNSVSRGRAPILRRLQGAGFGCMA